MAVVAVVGNFDFRAFLRAFLELWERSVRVHWQTLALAVGLEHRVDVLDEHYDLETGPEGRI